MGLLAETRARELNNPMVETFKKIYFPYLPTLMVVQVGNVDSFAYYYWSLSIIFCRPFLIDGRDWYPVLL